MKLKFTGEKYVGDGLHCWKEYPETCNVNVPEEKGNQLLADFPDQWEKLITGIERIKMYDKFIDDINKPLKKVKLTKDQINDKAAELFPGLNVNTYDKKNVMIQIILDDVKGK